TGLPPNALGLFMLGYTAIAVPVSTVLPQGLPGCTLLVSPDELTLRLPTAGGVTTTLAIPGVPALVGATLQQQMASIELDQNGAITAIATTAALTLTIGSF
ncbi:MAG: hypothetical protein JNN13_18215, partial [Planctomycetes bacterium]|nr:hypothetical protein [Planctomycetota bacterium]